MSGSGPGHGDLPVVGTFGPSLRWRQTVDKFLKSLINQGCACCWNTWRSWALTPLLPSRRRLAFFALEFSASSPPSVSLVLSHLPDFCSLSLTISLTLGFLHLSGLSHLVSCLLPAASSPLYWSPFPFPMTPDRVGRVQVFSFLFSF